MQEYSKQAARNIQDAFAEFLFDPFQDGVKGMLKSFLDAIRRMLANQAAAQLFNFLGSQGGFLGALFGGGRAMGGPVAAGTSYLVGERGPELFTPTTSGQISPAGGISITNQVYVDSRSDREQVVAELAPILQRTSDATVARVQQLNRDGRL